LATMRRAANPQGMTPLRAITLTDRQGVNQAKRIFGRGH
jgi:hypothetical protein